MHSGKNLEVYLVTNIITTCSIQRLKGLLTVGWLSAIFSSNKSLAQAEYLQDTNIEMLEKKRMEHMVHALAKAVNEEVMEKTFFVTRK
jgi:hypothetical protein